MTALAALLNEYARAVYYQARAYQGTHTAEATARDIARADVDEAIAKLSEINDAFLAALGTVPATYELRVRRHINEWGCSVYDPAFGANSVNKATRALVDALNRLDRA